MRDALVAQCDVLDAPGIDADLDAPLRAPRELQGLLARLLR